MKLRNVFILFLFLGLNPVSIAGPRKSEKSWQENLILSAKILRQADAVTREMGWVVSNVRQPSGSSAFGRLQRAFVKEVHGKLQKSPVLKCDTYKIKNLGEQVRPWKLEIFEACNTKYPLHLATVTLEKSDQLHIDFYPMNLSEELGLTASVMNKKTHCDLSFQGSILKIMNCQNWAQDRSKTEVVDLSTFIYTADKESLLQIKGVILEGLNPKSNINSEVPLKGRIIVTESELKEKEPVPVEGEVVPVRRHHKRKKPSAENLPDPEYIEGQERMDNQPVSPVPLENHEPVGEPSNR